MGVKKVFWKKLNAVTGLEETLDEDFINLIQTNIRLETSDEALGKYVCYVQASTGTVQKMIEIKKNNENEKYYELKLEQNLSKVINLNAEKVNSGEFIRLNDHERPQIEHKYEFECITG